MLDTEETVRSFDPEWQPPTEGHRSALAFRCDTPAEVDSAYANLLEHGGTGHKEPWDAFWGMRYAEVKDPDGNVVAIWRPVSDMSRRRTFVALRRSSSRRRVSFPTATAGAVPRPAFEMPSHLRLTKTPASVLIADEDPLVRAREDGSSCWGTQAGRASGSSPTRLRAQFSRSRPDLAVLVLGGGSRQHRTFELHGGGSRVGVIDEQDGSCRWRTSRERVLRGRADRAHQGDRRARRERRGHLAERSSDATRRVRSSSLVQ